jgi:hypothetical protein
MLTNSLPDRFWKKVVVGAENECWNWVGSIVGGYGHFHAGPKVKKAHRLSYENRWGTIPDGLIVMHSCDNRACVNPKHLVLGTIFDNNKDRDTKKRHRSLRGEQHGMARNTIQGVKKIKQLQRKHGEEVRALAKELGISAVTVRDVMTGRTWKWLD